MPCLFNSAALHIFGETLVGRQVFEPGYFSEMTHPAVAPCVFAEDEFAFPKSDRAMLFECSHSKHDPVIVEMRHAPFYCLLHLRASLVNQLPDMSQNRLCKRCSPCDIGINPRILASHDGRVNFRGARRQPICRTHQGMTVFPCSRICVRRLSSFIRASHFVCHSDFRHFR